MPEQPQRESSTLWVNRRLWTGFVTAPSSMRNRPSRVMPVRMVSRWLTTFTYQNRRTSMPRSIPATSSSVVWSPGAMWRLAG